MSGRLANMTAAITGSSSGNGRAIALAFASEGAAVLCADRRRDPLPGNYDDEPEVATDQLIVKRGGRAYFVETDVLKIDQIERSVAACVSQFGRIDVMVNNAGVFSGAKSIIDETEADWDFTVGVNAKGAWAGCKFAIQAMMKQNFGAHGQRGRIINLSSI